MTAATILRTYRLAFGALILIASVQAMITETRHVLFVAAAEIAGALLLLWQKSRLVGASVLLLVFAAVEALHIAEGQWPTYPAQYAATTVFIVLLDRVFLAREDLVPHDTSSNGTGKPCSTNTDL